MAKLPSLVIDIGHQRIKVLQLRPAKNGVEVVKVGSERLGLAANADNETIFQRVQEVLAPLLQSMGVKEKRAVVSIPGKNAFTRQIRIPVVRGTQLARIIKYEAKQAIPFPLEDINLDYQVSNTSGDFPELEVALVAVRKDVAEGYSNAVKKCGIQSDYIEAAPLSIYNAYAVTKHRDAAEVTAVISVGASSTDIVIEQNGQMQFMRSAAVAGNTLTTMLVKKLDISEEEAEKLKRKPADQYEEGDANAEEVAAVLEKGFESIVTEIRRSFDFYVSQPDSSPVTRIFLTGGTVNIEGVTEFLEDRLGVPVTILDATETDVVSAPPEHKDFLRKEANLVGMAARAAGKAACTMSFSPAAIKQKLELERRAPMLGTMAFLLVLMIAGSVYFLNTLIEKQAYAVNQMQEIVSPGVSALPELKEVRDLQEKYDLRFARINQIVGKRAYLTKIFLEVQQLLPQDIWVESIKQTSLKMTIEGKALTMQAIATYLQNLTMSPYFNNNAVGLTDTNVEADTAQGRTQTHFTITILEFRDPTESEITFVDELRNLTKGVPILIVQIQRVTPDDPTSDGTVIVGTYDTEKMEERVAFMSKVYAALKSSGDTTIKTVDLRFHDQQSNLMNHYKIPIDQIDKFEQRQLSLEDFVGSFEQLTPQLTPTPTATPTPGQEDGQSSGMGGYGGMMGGYGGMMGGYGGGMMGGGF